MKSSLATIDAKQKELDAAGSKRDTIPSVIEVEITRQKNAIDARWKAIQQGQPDWTLEQKDLMKRILADRQIALEGRIIFDQSLFLTKLKGVLNLRSFKASSERSTEDKILETFPISHLPSFLKFMQAQFHVNEEEGFVS